VRALQPPDHRAFGPFLAVHQDLELDAAGGAGLLHPGIGQKSGEAAVRHVNDHIGGRPVGTGVEPDAFLIYAAGNRDRLAPVVDVASDRVAVGSLPPYPWHVGHEHHPRQSARFRRRRARPVRAGALPFSSSLDLRDRQADLVPHGAEIRIIKPDDQRVAVIGARLLLHADRISTRQGRQLHSHLTGGQQGRQAAEHGRHGRRCSRRNRLASPVAPLREPPHTIQGGRTGLPRGNDRRFVEPLMPPDRRPCFVTPLQRIAADDQIVLAVHEGFDLDGHGVLIRNRLSADGSGAVARPDALPGPGQRNLGLDNAANRPALTSVDPAATAVLTVMDVNVVD